MFKLAKLLDPLPENWTRHKDPDGREFFFNALTQKSVYERPQPLPDGWRERRDPQSGVVCAARRIEHACRQLASTRTCQTVVRSAQITTIGTRERRG